MPTGGQQPVIYGASDMRHLLVTTVCVLFSLLAASEALATRYTQVIFAADCQEWNADVMVRLNWHVDRTDLAYDVAIEDLDGNVLLGTSGVETLIDDDGDHYASALLGEIWDNVTEEIIPLYGVFVVRASFTLVATPENPVSEPFREEVVSVECAVVPNADLSWGAAKSQYR